MCGEHNTAPATPMAHADTGSPMQISSSNNSPRPTPGFSASPHASSPTYQNAIPSQSSAAVASLVTSKDFDPYAHLKPEKMAQLNDELRQAEMSFAPRFKEAEDIKDLNERKAKVDALHNSFSTRQSIIRKKYGVRLRNRRTKAEIAGERHRLGLKHTSPGQLEETPNSKRPRMDQGSYYSFATASSPSSVAATPSKHLPVSDLNTGLGGSSATVATADPTLSSNSQRQGQGQASQPVAEKPTPQSSLSSFQRKGYRVSSHVTQANQPSPASASSVPSPPGPRQGSASAPVVLDDDDGESSDGDSDSDEEIPASLPLGARKTSGTPQKGLAG